MKPGKTGSLEVLIIGYGNPNREDDGIGHYAVDRLKKRLGHIPAIDFLTLHQLTPDLVETIQQYDVVVFIDATVESAGNGFSFSRVEPEFGLSHRLTHDCHPSFLLGLVRTIYHHHPMGYEVAIQGDSFGFRQEPTPEAMTRAEKAVSEIIPLLTQPLKYLKKGVVYGKRNRYTYC